MANETTITVRGNLGADPQFFEGANGCAARFNVAVSVAKFRPDQGSVENLVPQWFSVKAFGDLGRNIMASVRRGTPVIVRGELVTEYWRDSSNEEHSRQVIRADSVGIDLRHGTVTYMKTVRNAPEADALDGVRPAPEGATQGAAQAGQAADAGDSASPRDPFDVSHLLALGDHSAPSPGEPGDEAGDDDLGAGEQDREQSLAEVG